MTDQLNGLRFDIYERVHLPEEVAAIEELEEIELVPHMQALPQDDQVLLRGHLLLTGVYRNQENGGLSQLEHWIPVEISLPLNRIQSVEELAAEIDNFDVDLISTRSLNVTGVLALRGLEMQATQSPVWRDDSFTVVHQAQKDSQEEESISGESRSESGQQDAPALASDGFLGGQALLDEALIEQEREDEWGLKQETDAALAYETVKEAKESSWLSMFQHLEETRREEPEAPQPELSAFEAQEPDSGAGEAPLWGDLSKDRQNEGELNAELGEASDPDARQPATEDRPEFRVALGGKPLDPVEQAVPPAGVGLLAQLGEKGAKREAELRMLEAAQAEEKAQQESQAALGSASSGDELEWKRLFLSNGRQDHSFRKVRMCIVQKEETLDLIADRYNLQSRELQMYNRLQEPYLSEGQVLYIP
ncbi:LysM peptidoglycan-binding domain-containing protein [Cohnella boryungensis]|uniref:LysM peptidoglycan-binding domain-containing protein n=1 Tax=Cohnella boryungensis TaxID=768479 RepID=A0ABV8SFE2_9BACL